MTEERAVDAGSMVFHQDPARYRRARRIELVGVTAVPGIFIAFLCVLPSPGPEFGLGLLVLVVIVFVAAARLRWNANPPTLVVDTLGVTYRDRHLGITFKDRSLDKHLTWSEIDCLEIYQGDLTSVSVKPIQADANPEIVFQPNEVRASESDLVEALVRFAPERLRSLIDKRPPGDNLWAALAGLVLVLLLSGLFAWQWTSDAIEGYQATHHGIPGTAVVTHIDWGRGQSSGRSITGDFTPSTGGPVRRGVSIVTEEAVGVGDTIHVNAGGPDPNAVYKAGSRDWVGNVAGAAVSGAIFFASLITLCVFTIRRLPKRSTVER
jgi:hypothetical protein